MFSEIQLGREPRRKYSAGRRLHGLDVKCCLCLVSIQQIAAYYVELLLNRYGDRTRNISDDEMKEIAKQANAHQFISNFDQVVSNIGDGGTSLLIFPFSPLRLSDR